jgi:hypothetical protein
MVNAGKLVGQVEVFLVSTRALWRVLPELAGLFGVIEQT